MLKKQIFIFFVLLHLNGCAMLQGYEAANFTVHGNTAVMVGVIDSDIVDDLEQLLENNPQLKTIVMQDVEGSVDDEANLIAARIVRQRKLNTLVPSNGVIASGGTDFFLAGVNRTVQPGAEIGVHSWAGDGIEDAAQLPRTHPQHAEYLNYYKEMGIPSEFYWFTLKAAPSYDIHWMTEAQIKQYKITSP